jgi:hypothetical protein
MILESSEADSPESASPSDDHDTNSAPKGAESSTRVSQAHFLRAVFSEQEGYLRIAWKAPFGDRYISYPDRLGDALDVIEHHAGSASVYVGAQLYNEPTGGKEHIADEVTALWADLDGCDPAKLKVPPSIVVETSPSRWQAWWLLRQPLNSVRAEEITKAIAYYHADDGADTSGWDLTQLMRVPYTRNFKPDYDDRPEVVIVDAISALYGPGDFHDYPAVTKESPKGGQDDLPLPSPDDLPDEPPKQLLERYLTDRNGKPNQVRELFETVPDEDWSKPLFRLECQLFEAGATKGEVFAIAEAPACNKYDRERRGWEPLWQEVKKAFAHVQEQADQQRKDAAPGLFRRYSLRELRSLPTTFDWVVQGMLVDPTYGMLAGELKTLKTHIGTFIIVGVASGMPIFDQFKVPRARPVVAYIGEGGRIPFTRRLYRIAAAMGVDLDHDSIIIEPSFDIAGVQSERFRKSLARDLAEVQPGLVWIDPYYAYHGQEAKASNLFEEGGQLQQLSSTCIEAGASLLVNNHFNQTGSGFGLKRITQAAGGEWVDSWLLVGHREPADVPNGLFRLSLEIGSRQWGASAWNLDLNVGAFDEITNDFDGEITWNLERIGGIRSPEEVKVLRILRDHEYEYTRTQLAGEYGGNTKAAYEVSVQACGIGSWGDLDQSPRIITGVHPALMGPKQASRGAVEPERVIARATGPRRPPRTRRSGR